MYGARWMIDRGFSSDDTRKATLLAFLRETMSDDLIAFFPYRRNMDKADAAGSAKKQKKLNRYGFVLIITNLIFWHAEIAAAP